MTAQSLFPADPRLNYPLHEWLGIAQLLQFWNKTPSMLYSHMTKWRHCVMSPDWHSSCRSETPPSMWVTWQNGGIVCRHQTDTALAVLKRHQACESRDKMAALCDVTRLAQLLQFWNDTKRVSQVTKWQHCMTSQDHMLENDAITTWINYKVPTSEKKKNNQKSCHNQSFR